MSEMRVVFRVDGSREIGLGHIMRCLNVARYLDRIPVVFAVTENDDVRKVLEKTDFRDVVKWISSDADDVKAFADILDDLDPKIVVTDIDLRGRVDKYMSVVYPRPHVSLHEHNYSLLVGDKVIAPTVKPLKIADSGTRDVTHFTGPDYILLPPDIIERRDNSPEPKFPPRKIVAGLGGGDPSRLTPKVASAIRGCNMPRISWKIVLGPASGYDRWEMAREFPGGIEFIPGGELSRDEFLDLLASADLAIVNGGTTLYESLALGRPSLAVPQNDFEKDVVETLSESGAVTGLMEQDKVTLLETLTSLINDRQRLESTAQIGRKLIDGKGSERVAELIISHLK